MTRGFASGHQHDVGRSYGSSEPAKPEPASAELKARWAENVATNVEGAVTNAEAHVSAMHSAHTEGNVEAYGKARAEAERAIAHLRELCATAKEHAPHASQGKHRERLGTIDAVVASVQAKLDAAPSAPEPTPPTLRNHEALLAALPRPDAAGPAKQHFDEAQANVLRIVREMPYSDFVGFQRIIREFPTHEIAIRFERFGTCTKNAVLGMLDRDDSGKLKARMRARDAKQAARAANSDANPSEPIPLPNEVRGDLESAVGRSLSHVRLHADAKGNDVAAAHSARAVAIGSNIYFGEGQLDASSPAGRELLAHEVGHVVQAETLPGHQGPAAKRDDASAGTDAAEADADTFAAGFRDYGAGAKWTPLATTSQQAMRAPAAHASAAQTTQQTAPLYVNKHIVHVVGEIRERILAASLSQPHARLTWSSIASAQTAISTAILRYARSGGDASLKMLMKLSFPNDLLAVVAQARQGVSGSEWDPAVGIAIANEMLVPLDQSIKRMGERLRVRLDDSSTMPRASDLVASSAMDGVIAEVLCQPGMVIPDQRKNTKGDDTHGKAFRDGAREVEWEPAGASDPQLWNFIKVTAPKNATAEDVAKTPIMGGEVTDGSEQAHRIHASPPFFGLPIETAKNVPALVRYAPPEVKDRLAAGDLGPRVADGAALANSAVADEAALAQTTKAPKGTLSSDRILERAAAQLAFLTPRLQRWHIAAPVSGVAQFVERRKADLSRDSKAGAKWHDALVSMEAVLADATQEASDALDELEEHAKPKDAQQAKPQLRVLEAYAHAVGVAHLPAEAQAALGEARMLRKLLPLALAEESIDRARTSLADEHENEHQVGAAHAPMAQDPQVAALSSRAADLRLSVARGGRLDANAAEELAVDADEIAVRARIGTIKTLVGNVEERADALGMTPETFTGGLPTLRAVLKKLLHEKIPHWISDLDNAKKWKGPTPNRSADQTVVAQRSAAISRTATAISAFSGEVELEKWMKWAHERINDEQLRQRINHLALEMGIMIVTGQVGGALVAGLRGLAIGGELMAGAREMSLAWEAAEIAINATLATGTQAAMGGELSGKAFAENVLALTFASTALRPFKALFADAEAVEADIAKTWVKLAKGGSKFAAQVAVQTAAGVGSTALASGLVGHGDAMSGGDDWMDQGIAIAASHFVAQRTRGMHERISQAAMEFGQTPEFRQLLARVEGLTKRAEKGTATPADAQKLLADRHSALVEERQLYQHLASSHDAKQANAGAVGLHAMAADAGANLVDASLRLSGLKPVVHGHVYEGTHADIDNAVAAAKASNDAFKYSVDVNSGTHTIIAGDRKFTIHEIGASTANDHGLGARVAAQPGVRYVSEGRFEVDGPSGPIGVDVRRTSGATKVEIQGEHATLDIPRGLSGKEFEHAVATGLAQVRESQTPAGPTSSAQEVEAVVQSTPVLDSINEVTGVEKGPAYAQQMASLREFYAQMDAEGRASHTRNRGHAKDGGYGWDYGHDAFAFSHGLATFEVRVYLDTSNVTPADAAHLRQQVYAGVDHHYNAKKFSIRGPDGKARQMHIEVVFVDDPGVSHLKVTAHPGNGFANVFNWFVGGNQTTHAHEVTHGAFGIKDEYHDRTGRAPDRSTPQSPGVRTDQSIMGDYWIGDPIVDNHADPATSVKQRHVDEIGTFSPAEPKSAPRQQQQTNARTQSESAQKQSTAADAATAPAAPKHSAELEKAAHELGVTVDQLEGTLSLIHDRDAQTAARIRKRLIDGHSPLSKSDRTEFEKKLEQTKHASAISHEGAMARIAEFRRRANLPAYNPDVEGTGTVAMAVVQGQEFFGINSGFSPSSLTLRKETLARIHAEGHGEGVSTVLHRALALTHAEAHSLMLAYNQLGDLKGTVVVHVDRKTCGFCSAEKGAVAALQRLYGIQELVIIDGDGHRWTFPRGKEQ